jgi:sporulation protein YlmC with PRC-barrel domain
MKKTALVMLVALAVFAAASREAYTQVAGTVTLGVAVAEMKEVATGWSAKKQFLGKTVVNEKGEKVGKIEDVIITPEKAISYVIIGAGGFLGIAKHDVAIPVTQLKHEGDKIVLPGATKDAVKALPKFEYAKG